MTPEAVEENKACEALAIKLHGDLTGEGLGIEVTFVCGVLAHLIRTRRVVEEIPTDLSLPEKLRVLEQAKAESDSEIAKILLSAALGTVQDTEETP